jgi:hypothetical protein
MIVIACWMPAVVDGDGYDVARVLWREHVAHETAIVALTGTTINEIDPAHAAGIDLVLSKPVNCNLLGGLLADPDSPERDRQCDHEKDGGNQQVAGSPTPVGDDRDEDRREDRDREACGQSHE